MLILFFSQLDKMVFNNDWLNNMGMGIVGDFDRQYIDQFAEKVERNCEDVYADDPQGKQDCVAYQSVVRIHVPFAHPFFALAGATLTDISLEASPEEFTRRVQTALVYAGLFSTALLIFVVVLAVFAVQSEYRVAFAALILTSQLLNQSLDLSLVNHLLTAKLGLLTNDIVSLFPIDIVRWGRRMPVQRSGSRTSSGVDRAMRGITSSDSRSRSGR